MRKVLLMGLFSLLFGCNDADNPSPQTEDSRSREDLPSRAEIAPSEVTVDVCNFSVAGSEIGRPIATSSPFAKQLEKNGVYAPQGKGLELAASGGSLEYVFLTLKEFNGDFACDGERLELGPQTTEREVRERFGEPYWTDRDDGEAILFYEYQKGEREVQFEFPEDGRIGYITLSRSGDLSDPEQRKAYGVDKPWPPH